MRREFRVLYDTLGFWAQTTIKIPVESGPGFLLAKALAGRVRSSAGETPSPGALARRADSEPGTRHAGSNNFCVSIVHGHR